MYCKISVRDESFHLFNTHFSSIILCVSMVLHLETTVLFKPNHIDTLTHPQDRHLLWNVDKDVFAPVRWRDETMAFGAGKTFTHASKHRTLWCISGPMANNNRKKRHLWLKKKKKRWAAQKCLFLGSCSLKSSGDMLQPVMPLRDSVVQT